MGLALWPTGVVRLDVHLHGRVHHLGRLLRGHCVPETHGVGAIPHLVHRILNQRAPGEASRRRERLLGVERRHGNGMEALPRTHHSREPLATHGHAHHHHLLLRGHSVVHGGRGLKLIRRKSFDRHRVTQHIVCLPVTVVLGGEPCFRSAYS